MKQNRRNIGRPVVVDRPGHPLHGRLGVVGGFRGDDITGTPIVTVSFNGRAYPVKGSFLKRIKK